MKNIVRISLVVLLLIGGVSAADAMPGAKPDEISTATGPGGTIAGTLSSVWLRKYSMIVYLEGEEGLSTPLEEKLILNQKNKMFVPHVMAVPQGTTIHYVNHDDVKHNVYFIAPDETILNLGTGAEDWSREVTMDQVGVYAHRCNVHDEMSAYIVVFGHPHFELIEKGAAKKSAEFRLDGVPAGTYQLRVWCEKYYADKDHPFNTPWEVSVQDGEETSIEVKPKTK